MLEGARVPSSSRLWWAAGLRLSLTSKKLHLFKQKLQEFLGAVSALTFTNNFLFSQ
jgi:hypothetical protein